MAVLGGGEQVAVLVVGEDAVSSRHLGEAVAGSE